MIRMLILLQNLRLLRTFMMAMKAKSNQKGRLAHAGQMAGYLANSRPRMMAP
jgi:hypothetical protein